tara:strand:+ start:498 stop:971 length:474 start_codon:yes stop_codon:yes gene_type:complete
VIKAGSMTLIDAIPYSCIKVEHGMAYLKKVGDENRGRFKKVRVELCPYVNEKNEFIVPKPPPVNRKRMARFHFMKVIKECVDMPLSHDLAYFVAEWLETIVYNAAGNAEHNAQTRGDERITAAHWPSNTEIHNQEGFWPQNRDYAKDYKQYLKEGGQ